MRITYELVIDVPDEEIALFDDEKMPERIADTLDFSFPDRVYPMMTEYPHNYVTPSLVDIHVKAVRL